MALPPVGFRVVRVPGGFERRVVELVGAIPPGTVASYGRVAEWAGAPGAARAVGRVLAAGIAGPWHRVVTAGGRLAPGLVREQARLLAREGVSISAGHVAVPIPWWAGPAAAAGAGRAGSPSRVTTTISAITIQVAGSSKKSL